MINKEILLKRVCVGLLLGVALALTTSPASAGLFRRPQRPVEEAAVTADQAVLLKLVNRARMRRGIKPFKLNTRLCALAALKSNDMVKRGYRGHISPKYGSPPNFVRANGITFDVATENIAWMQKTPEAAFETWMASSGHKRNILRRDLTEIGIGRDSYGQGVWTQLFIGK